MVQTVGGVQIEIRGDDSHFERTMREVRSEAGRTGQTMAREFRTADAAAAKLNTSLRSTATSALALTAAFGVGAGLAGGVRIIAGFSQAMATLRAITGGTAEEIAALEQLARQLGSSTKYSASQAADAMTELARAGFDTKQVIAAIPSVLSLATAGGVELAAAAEITGVTLAQFGLQAAEAARVADVLAEAANRSNVGVTDLGEALKYAGPTGKALGLDLEQTVAVLAALGDGGLKGGQGGRSFGSVGVQLVNMREEITALIGTYDIAAEGIQGVIKRLVEAGITTEQVISIFRGENIDTFNILAAASTSTTKSIDGFVAGLKSAEGASARVAAVMADNLNGAISSAASAFEELIIALGKAGAEAALLDAVKGLTQLLVLAARNADILGVAIVAMSARALIPLAASTVPAAIGALRGLGTALAATQGAAAKAAVALNLVGGPLTLAIAAAAVAYVAYARSVVTAQEAQAKFNATAEKLEAVRKDTIAATGDLRAANERLTAALAAQEDQAAALARTEIDAINRRLRANRELEASYRAQLTLDLSRARTGLQSSQNKLGERFGLRATFDFTSSANVTSDALASQIAEFNRKNDAILKAGGTLSKRDAETQQWIIQYLEYQQTLAGLEGAFKDLTAPRALPFGYDLREYQGGGGTPAGNRGGGLTSEQQANLAALRQAYELDLAIAQENDELSKQLADQIDILSRKAAFMKEGMGAVEAERRATEEVTSLRAATTAAEQRRLDFATQVLDLENQIKLAQLAGNETLAKAKQDELDILQTAIDLQELQIPLEQAKALAAEQVTKFREASNAQAEKELKTFLETAAIERALVIARAQGDAAQVKALEDQLELRRLIAEYESKGVELPDAVSYANADLAAQKLVKNRALRDGIAQNIAAGLEQGIRDGDWGEAFRGILAQSVADAMRDALNEVANLIVDLLGGVLDGIGASIGSSLFSFGGARAGGGPVKAGSRYMVGESGPEMFVPSVPGMILPKSEFPSSVAGSGGFGMGAFTLNAPLIVQGNVTEDVIPTVQAMMAEQARELPRMVNAVIRDGQRRGRF